MNLTDVATFLMTLIKLSKTRVNKKMCDTKRSMREITVSNGWNTQIIQILREIRDGNFFF